MKKHILLTLFLFTLTYLLGCSNKKDKVIVYSAQEDFRITALKEAIKNSPFSGKVIISPISSGALLQKIINEKNTDADIIVDLGSSAIKQLKDKLANINDLISTNKYNPSLKTLNDDYFRVFAVWYGAVVYNTNFIKQSTFSSSFSYKDILNIKNNNIVMPNPSTSGTGYMFIKSWKNTYKNDFNNFIVSLNKKIKHYTSSGSGPVKETILGEANIGMGMLFQIIKEKNNGAPIDYIIPKEGAPFDYSTIAIVKGHRNDLIDKFYTWLGTKYSNIDRKFIPYPILKGQKSGVNNFPKEFKKINMSGIENTHSRKELLKEWDENIQK